MGNNQSVSESFEARRAKLIIEESAEIQRAKQSAYDQVSNPDNYELLNDTVFLVARFRCGGEMKCRYFEEAAARIGYHYYQKHSYTGYCKVSEVPLAE